MKFRPLLLFLLPFSAGCLDSSMSWETLDGSSGSSIHLGLSGPATVPAGSCQKYQIQVSSSDLASLTSSTSSSSSSSTSSTSPLQVVVSATGNGQFYSDSTCSTASTSVSVPLDTIGASFYIKDTTAESIQISGAGSGATASPFNVSIQAGAADHLVLVTGAGQTGTVATSLPIAPQVKVVDVYGNPVSGATVTFSVTTGGGSVGASTITSDSSGLASTSFTLGTTAGASNQTLQIAGSPAFPDAGGLGAASISIIASAKAGAPNAAHSSISVASSTQAGAPATVTLTLADAYGNLISGALPQISVSGSATVTQASTATNASGQTTAQVSATLVQALSITYSDPVALNTLTAPLSIVAAPPTVLTINGSVNIPAGLCGASYPFSINTFDAYGNASSVTSALTVNLAGTGTTTFYSSSACSAGSPSVSIAVGTSSTSFYVKDTAAETPIITATAPSFTSSSFSFNSVYSLGVTPPAPPTAFTCQPYTIKTQDGNGVQSVFSTSSSTTISLSGSGTRVTPVFHSNSGCSSPTSTAVLAPGTSSVVVYLMVQAAEQINLSFGPSPSSAILNSVFPAYTVNPGPAVLLSIVGPSSTPPSGCVPMTVNSMDSGNSFSNVSAVITVNLTSNQGTGFFYSDNACSLPLSSVSVAAGSHAVQYYFKDTTIRTHSLTAAAAGMTSGTFTMAVASAPTVSQVAIGPQHACAVVSGGVKCWGDNSSGQLGNNSTTSSLIPVTPIAAGSAATQVSAGSSHTCAVVNGGVQCWGSNIYGQLGNGTTTTSLVPVTAIAPGSGVTSVAVGMYHTCAIVNGGVGCWGYNSDGQIGNGTTANQFSPTQVFASGSGATQIATGGYFTCAVISGGVQCWGAGISGQLGSGSATSSSYPVTAIAASGGASAIAAGYDHACAVVNGGVQCWGYNNGDLGNGVTGMSATPVTAIAAGGGATAVAAGIDHSCAVVNGGVQCWGAQNADGQLGNNTTTAPQYSPAQVTNLPASSGATGISISPYGYSTCAFVNNSGLCWGRNLSGQLGNNSYSGSLVPVPQESLN